MSRHWQQIRTVKSGSLFHMGLQPRQEYPRGKGIPIMSFLRVRMAANENKQLKQWIWRRPGCIAEAGAAVFRSGEKKPVDF